MTGAVALVQMLEQHGVGIAYDPPFQTRDILGVPDRVTIHYLCTAPDEAIDAVMAQFENSGHGAAGSLTLESSCDDAENGGSEFRPGRPGK